MYLQSVGGRSGNSRSTPENQLQAVSMKSPSWNRLKSTRFEASPSLPGDLLGEFPANGDVEGEIEDTTLYYAAPSLADLTAFASGIIGGLISSASRIFKAPIPEVSAVDLVSLPSQLDIIRPHTAVLNTYEELSKSSAAETQDYITSAPGGSILAPPTCLKRSITAYGIIGTLGRGTYGKVVLGCLKDDFDGDLYAIKIVPKAGTRSNIPELAILEFISNISKIKDGDRDKWGVAFLQRMRETLHSDESFFIVLEYYPATLSDTEVSARFRVRESQAKISASISLPLNLTWNSFASRSLGDETAIRLRVLIAEISLGLSFLHYLGIVHQDIKPANVMVSFAGHAVIGDFGAATKMPLFEGGASECSHSDLPTELRRQDQKYGPIVLQPEDFVTFTPLYAAPELRERTIEGLVIYDERSDWWSLGVLLYELVTGTVPFVFPGGSDALRGRRSNGDRSLALGELQVPSGSSTCDWRSHLEDLLKSLLSAHPSNRLSWPDIKGCAFLEPIEELWDDIAQLKYPPCPDPPTAYVDSDTRLTVEQEEEAEGEAETDSYSLPNTTRSAQLSHFSSDKLHDSSIQAGLSFDNPFRSSLQISLLPLWYPPISQPLDDSQSEDESILQPMPSSASLWWTEHGPESTEAFIVPDLQPSESRNDYFDSPPMLLSPFSSRSLLRLPKGASSDFQHARCQEGVYSRSLIFSDLVPERITISLLEAMDKRDQVAETRDVEKGQVFSRPRQRDTAFRRVWKRFLPW